MTDLLSSASVTLRATFAADVDVFMSLDRTGRSGTGQAIEEPDAR
ncbi:MULTISPECIES: hypothetical protein [Microbacterium]|jgi:hypothetical protein|nr:MULTISPECIES: hypothetical protein [Microbacterium]